MEAAAAVAANDGLENRRQKKNQAQKKQWKKPAGLNKGKQTKAQAKGQGKLSNVESPKAMIPNKDLLNLQHGVRGGAVGPGIYQQ